ncbi:L-glutamate gamma-semialdehyde dehydrogenase [Candidatus Poribacteria bacterium]|nr:L-glutamate gamma-semialdehyde dehydrogenase [Candidatus Poribacteria bacterium]
MPSPNFDDKHIEIRTKAIGFELFSKIEEKKPSILESQWWENQILEWCMKNEAMKTQLLRFVDVFPSLQTPRQLVSHLRQYFPKSNRAFPAFLRFGIDLSSPTALTRSVVARETRAMMTRMAQRFIAGSNIEDSFENLKEIRRQGMTFTIDLLGEAVVSESEADRYMNAYIDALRALSTRWRALSAGAKQNDSPNISLKLSSLYSRFDPVDEAGSKEIVKQRLRKMLRTAGELGAFVNIDMEQYSSCELTLEIFRELLEESEFRALSNVGIVAQAYLRDSERMIRSMLQWLRHRKTPVTVRLVKGAYWDYEIIHAKQMGWPVPVFISKPETDANFERLTRVLLENSPAVRTAIGSHNVRSIAYAMALAETLGVKPANLEFQMLYGMGDSIKRAILKTDHPLRVYAPFGDLIPGMAYLVRRILENTSNESFLRQDFFMGLSPEELLRNPAEIARTNAEAATSAVGKEPTNTLDQPLKTGQTRGNEYREFVNEPTTDFSRADSRKQMREAIDSSLEQMGQYYPLVIGGKRIETTEASLSINPSHKRQIIGRVAQASIEDADYALKRARDAFETWRTTPAAKRAELLLNAAEIMSRKRFELAALEVHEVGKGWREADADVAEAIDHLRYYACEMVRLNANPSTCRMPGEKNEYVYRSRGVGAIIAPWNFPLAILAGMSSAAIVTGNTVIMKPAPQSAITAARLMRIYEEAGIPAGVVNYLPGRGETVGEYLVKSPEVDFIAFTGSRDVGIRINTLAARHPAAGGVKRVVAEMGGKNAIIIDESADLDEAISGATASAFGYQGQKCSAASRVIVLESSYRTFASRLTESAGSLRIGPAEDPSNHVGPLIDEEALKKVLHYIDVGRREAKVLLEPDVSLLEEGFFVGPVVFADVSPKSTLAQDEIFGPALAVLKARDFEEALRIANDTPYGLTGGIYSRTPENIERARRDLMVGNLYINRKITGAIVKRQPFGGFKMSGIGSKAGGPDYLVQFMLPQTVSENVMRHGFAPL